MYVKNDRWQFLLLWIKIINYRNLVIVLKTYDAKFIFNELANTPSIYMNDNKINSLICSKYD